MDLEEFVENDGSFGSNSNASKRLVKFNKAWVSKYPWIQEGLDGKAFCTVCSNSFSVGHGGENDVKRHMLTKTHRELVSLSNLVSSTNKALQKQSIRRKNKFSDKLAWEFPVFKKTSVETEAHCDICDMAVSIANKGRADLKQHLNTSKHQQNAQSKNTADIKLKNQQPSATYCSICLKWTKKLIASNKLDISFVTRKFAKLQEEELICETCSAALHFIDKFGDMCGMKSERLIAGAFIGDSEIQTDFLDSEIIQALQHSTEWVYFVLNQMVESLDTSAVEEKAEIKTEITRESHHKVEYVLVDVDAFDEDEKPEVPAEVAEEEEESTYKSKQVSCPGEKCNFVCSSGLKLKRHLLRKHREDFEENLGFVCDICQKRFPSKTRLQYHMNVHFNLRPYTCDYEGCTRTFRNPSRLRNHKQEFHMKIVRIHCEICGKALRTKAAYNIHILGHSDPTLPCEVCGKMLTNKKTLAQHLKIHTGQRDYRCTFEGCNKAFTKCSGLQVHIRTHSKIKPYECPECGQQFAYNVGLKKHRIRNHNADIKFMRKENPLWMPGKNVEITPVLVKEENR